MLRAETDFWNSKHIVNYFADKPADPVVKERLGKIAQPVGKQALDLGCGGGRHSELLAHNGFEVTAVDLNPEMLSHTQSRLKRRNLSANLARMSIANLGFRNNSFDVVVSTGVLHQAKSLNEYDRAVREVARVLKSGGAFTGNIFTRSAWDDTYTVPDPREPHTVVTKEGLWMTLLPKEMFYELGRQHGLQLEQEVTEDIRQENTGPRAVLRAHFYKT